MRQAGIAGFHATLVAVLLASLAWSPAQAQMGISGGYGVARATASHDANVIVVGGVAVPLLWAEGLTEPSDLAQYAALGLNTVHIRVGETSAGALAAASELAAAAEASGLLVVVTLVPRNLTDESSRGLAPNPRSQAYAAAANAFAATAVEFLGQHSRLIAWGVSVRPYDVVANDILSRVGLCGCHVGLARGDPRGGRATPGAGGRPF
jgi:hypothetical protein